MPPRGGVGSVCVSEEPSTAPKTDLEPIATNYQIFSAQGVSFPVGKLFYPSGHSHALILDPDYGRVGSLTPMEAWAIQGGLISSFTK